MPAPPPMLMAVCPATCEVEPFDADCGPCMPRTASPCDCHCKNIFWDVYAELTPLSEVSGWEELDCPCVSSGTEIDAEASEVVEKWLIGWSASGVDNLGTAALRNTGSAELTFAFYAWPLLEEGQCGDPPPCPTTSSGWTPLELAPENPEGTGAAGSGFIEVMRSFADFPCGKAAVCYFLAEVFDSQGNLLALCPFQSDPGNDTLVCAPSSSSSSVPPSSSSSVASSSSVPPSSSSAPSTSEPPSSSASSQTSESVPPSCCCEIECGIAGGPCVDGTLTLTWQMEVECQAPTPENNCANVTTGYWGYSISRNGVMILFGIGTGLSAGGSFPGQACEPGDVFEVGFGWHCNTPTGPVLTCAATYTVPE